LETVKTYTMALETDEIKIMSTPPDGLPGCRLLTGANEDAFCHRVSDALTMGYQLYGPPAATHNGSDVIVAQAILWPGFAQTAGGRL
jgi:hypothetical protein